MLYPIDNNLAKDPENTLENLTKRAFTKPLVNRDSNTGTYYDHT